jgi:hypothetical protein
MQIRQGLSIAQQNRELHINFKGPLLSDTGNNWSSTTRKLFSLEAGNLEKSILNYDRSFWKSQQVLRELLASSINFEPIRH